MVLDKTGRLKLARAKQRRFDTLSRRLDREYGDSAVLGYVEESKSTLLVDAGMAGGSGEWRPSWLPPERPSQRAYAGFPYIRPTPPLIFGREPSERYKSLIIQTYATSPQAIAQEYSVVVRRAAEHFYDSLPANMRRDGFKLIFCYDFQSSEDASKIEAIRAVGEPADLVYGLKAYAGHEMTRLDEEKIKAEDERVIHSRADIIQYMFDHLCDRALLKEVYLDLADEYSERGENPPSFLRPNHIQFHAWPLRLNRDAEIGSLISVVMATQLHPNAGAAGDCVFSALVQHLDSQRGKKRETVESLRLRVEIPAPK